MISITVDGIAYQGNKSELIQDFINLAFSIVKIGGLTEVETNRLCELIPTTIRNEDTSSKVQKFNIETRAEVINDLYAELNIRRLNGQ